jgi:teichuronic acid biosynthesis glycosyltransferase TuaH
MLQLDNHRVMSHDHQGTELGTVAVISLEQWDEVWRRNQHLASRLLVLGLADHVIYVNPASRAGAGSFSPLPGITVVSPRRSLPKRLGGLWVSARSLRKTITTGCDTLWINDPTTGAFLTPHPRAAYDVTDDWRTADLIDREQRRLVAAEDKLTRQARVIVCSEVLRERWHQRYAVDAVIVRNAVDVCSIHKATPRILGNGGPHIGYVGTLHDERLDVELVLATADRINGGTVHLVGPNSLSDSTRASLTSHPKVILHGSVPTSEVPSWLMAFDVLIAPHRVNQFTLSLDAIKSYEYLATDKPIVATPTSGFQELEAAGLVVTSEEFATAVERAAHSDEVFQRDVPDWDDRTREFATVLGGGTIRG